MRSPLRNLGRALILGPIVALLSCSGEDLVSPPTAGSIAITTTTTGPEPDPDGYAVSVNDGAEVGMGVNGTHQVNELPAGSYAVRLDGMATNCTVDGGNPRTVSVEAGTTATVQFNITCGPTTGSAMVTAATTGSSSDPDGYSVTLDGLDRGALAINGELTVAGLASGDHVVGLSGIAANCQAAGENPRAITVTAGSIVTAAFLLTCTTPPAASGAIRVTTTTSGASPDPDGYAFAVDGGTAQPIGTGASTTVGGVAAGNHSVTLSGLAGNCTVQGTNPRAVTLAAGATAELAFAVTCTAATGSLRIRTATTGSSPDQDGYTATVDAGTAQSIAVNGTRTVSGLNPGSHQVTLGGLASNCRVTGDNPRSASVSAGGTVELSFAITCSAATGSIGITTATTGASPDDGYTVAVDNGIGQPIGANATVTVSNVAPGVHQVALTGVAANCTVAGENPRPVTVTSGGPASIAFTITCTAPSSSSKIAFNSWDGGTAAIYVVNPDGTGLTKLTPQGEDDRRPVWSPDRSKIAFQRNSVEIWVMSADGSNRVRVTDRLADGNSPFRWSPDGSMIAFERNDETVECDLDGVPSPCPLDQVWTMRADGTNLRKVGNGTDPSWAPDSRRIAFTAESQIRVANADGTEGRTLTNQARGAFGPAWSPAGGRIAFVTMVQRARDVPEILVMNEDGTQVSNLTSGRGGDTGPVWSRDGSKLTFNTYDPLPEGTNSEVAITNPDGTGRRILTNNPAADADATWSPEGDRLAFMRKAYGDPTAIDVYVINVNGTGERNLTNNPEITDDWPSWSSE